jgi:MGT family glycosyltransferase
MRFLFAMWEGGGTVPPELALAGRLVGRGHMVHVLGDPTIEAGAARIGAGFTPWRQAPHVTSLRPEHALVKDWEIKNPLRLFRVMRDALLCGPTRLFAEETLAAIERVRPDVVAADFVMIGSLAAAQRARVPTALLVPNLYPFPAKGRPMIGSGSMPARGPLGWIRDAVMARVFVRLFDGGLAPVNDARTTLGLPPLAHTFDQATGCDVILLLTSEAFDFPGPPFPANVRFAGPQLDDSLWAEPWTSPWPETDSRPLVLVGFSSTFQNQAATLQRVMQALGELPVRGLVTAGSALEASELSPPPNVVVVASAPHGRIIPHSRVVVTHCGHGTTLKALSLGVPLLCMPMGRDQVDNAARTVWHGAGIRIKPSAPAETIAAALRKLLADDRYRQHARLLADRIAAESIGDRAIIEFEALASAAHNART